MGVLRDSWVLGDLRWGDSWGSLGWWGWGVHGFEGSKLGGVGQCRGLRVVTGFGGTWDGRGCRGGYGVWGIWGSRGVWGCWAGGVSQPPSCSPRTARGCGSGSAAGLCWSISASTTTGVRELGGQDTLGHWDQRGGTWATWRPWGSWGSLGGVREPGRMGGTWGIVGPWGVKDPGSYGVPGVLGVLGGAGTLEESRVLGWLGGPRGLKGTWGGRAKVLVSLGGLGAAGGTQRGSPTTPQWC